MQSSTLGELGWSAVHSRSLTLDDLAQAEPARVVGVERDRIDVRCERGELTVVVPPGVVAPDGAPVAVGDWVLLERAAPRVQRILERQSFIARRAAGTAVRMQPIAANVDTLFVVTSCNHDFNESRLERYLMVATKSAVPVVLVLTKRDLCAAPDEYVARARAVDARLTVIALDATARDSAAALAPWLARGQTVAFAGSSGVGKSTLVNALLHASAQLTAPIREDDARGRHTTTSRRMFALPGGAWVIDTPGMRELAVGASEEALDDVFADIAALAATCRFRDCAHGTDEGCAVQAALAAGFLDARRFESYRKLQSETRRAVRTEAQRRAEERQFGRMARQVMRHKKERRDR